MPMEMSVRVTGLMPMEPGPGICPAARAKKSWLGYHALRLGAVPTCDWADAGGDVVWSLRVITCDCADAAPWQRSVARGPAGPSHTPQCGSRGVSPRIIGALMSDPHQQRCPDYIPAAQQGGVDLASDPHQRPQCGSRGMCSSHHAPPAGRDRRT